MDRPVRTARSRSRIAGVDRTGPAAAGRRRTVPLARRQVAADAAAGNAAENAAESEYRVADRLFHAAIAAVTGGLSPISIAEAWHDWMLNLAVSPGKQRELLAKAIEKNARMQRFLAACATTREAPPVIEPLPQDRRFRAPAWQAFPFNVLQQSFLLTQQWWHNATTGVAGVSAQHERVVEFHSRQFLDMLSPSNFLATNPEILERTAREGGANLVRGLDNLVEDWKRLIRGERPPGAESFIAGETVAATPGDVIYRNELIELIQYRPSTATVRPEPVLIVPAWIMKYYILDLSPHNSLIRHLVAQGFTVFCISWRNPGPEHREVSLDDYRRLGVMAAADAVAAVAGGSKIHAVGYCLGGTLLSIAAAAMARDGDERLQSVSLFAAQVDFEEPGELGLFIDESQVTLIEDMMWQEGYLDQRRMAGAFQMIRSQDLVWSRLIGEYLMGERPPMTDLMAWNADATRMPYRMHSEYLRSLFLRNDLAQGRFAVDGRPVHIEDIAAPVFAVGTLTDHVAPWRSVFKLVHILDTDVDFVLTNGGHNAGIVAEPGNPRRAYRHLAYRHGTPHPAPDDWLKGADEQPGSWWPSWFAWLARHSGEQAVPGREAGGGRTEYRPIAAAPGTYVLQP
ncbi:MAG TPA: alpha/beta fold hydrolase [Rhizobiales bacterium]|nr:alpha/beta fold hydrolase [Hyphomicrobiales bacterium]